MTNGTVLTVGQMRELTTALAQGVPTTLPKDVAQQWIGAKEVLHARVRAFLLDVPNPYFSEIVDSNYGYPDGYSPKGVVEQAEVLSGFYPELNFDHVEELAKSWSELPEGAEHLQLCPKLTAVGEQMEIADPLGTGYGRCLEQVLEHIGSTRRFKNYREGALGENHVRGPHQLRSALCRLFSSG